MRVIFSAYGIPSVSGETLRFLLHDGRMGDTIVGYDGKFACESFRTDKRLINMIYDYPSSFPSLRVAEVRDVAWRAKAVRFTFDPVTNTEKVIIDESTLCWYMAGHNKDKGYDEIRDICSKMTTVRVVPIIPSKVHTRLQLPAKKEWDPSLLLTLLMVAAVLLVWHLINI